VEGGRESEREACSIYSCRGDGAAAKLREREGRSGSGLRVWCVHSIYIRNPLSGLDGLSGLNIYRGGLYNVTTERS